MRDVVTRLYRTKALLVSLSLTIGGVGLLIVGNAIEQADGVWRLVPFTEFGSILIGAGLLSVWFDFFLRREQAEIDDARLRTVMAEHAPVMRDAVLQAFAADHDDLKRVATTETLDGIIENSLALRLDDNRFAKEIYADIRQQAIEAPERWHDATLAIDLAPDTEDSKTFYSVTVRWEYTVTPVYSHRRFVCVSDRDEYTELAGEPGGTSPWFIDPETGINASDTRAFELIRFAIDGEERHIRRTSRKNAQTYTVAVGKKHLDAGEPVTVSYTYRTITRRDQNLLFFDIEQPTRNLDVRFDYEGTVIDTLSVLDMIPATRTTRTEAGTSLETERIHRLSIDGWVFPRAGVAYVWRAPGSKADGGGADVA